MGMAIRKPAIVMALYDIGRDNWDAFNLSYNTYLAWMKNTLAIDACFVIYTEAKFYDRIVEYRKQFDPELKKTVIVVTPLSELDCYKQYNQRLEMLMFSEEFKEKDHHRVPEMTKPLYNVIMFNKLNFLKHAKDSNYFNSDFLIWADAGGLRDDISNYQGEVWPSLEKLNKLDPNKITFFSHSAEFDVPDKEFHSFSQIRHIQGTAFFVPAHMIDDLIIEFNQTIEESLSQKYIGSDEKVFDITYCKNKHKYNLIQCTWRTYFDLFKESKKTGPHMKLKLVTTTWSHQDTFEIEKTSLYKSFKRFNPNIDIEHFHFNRGHYYQKENEFASRFGAESEYLLYKIQLLLEKAKTVNSDYIIFCDANDVTCMRSVDYLLDMFDLEKNIIVGHEKNTWPTQERKGTWPNYRDYDEKHMTNRTFLNSGMILSKTEKFIEMLQSMVDNVFSTNINTFSNDQGVYTYYYNMGLEPKIKLDTSNIFALNTFSRNVNEFYLNNDNKLVSHETSVMPCFIHDNGWNHGSPKYNIHFELKRLYSDSYPHLKNISIQRPIGQIHQDYLINLRDNFGFTPNVTYDVGACVLHWTTIAKEVWPNSQYILLEAMEESEELFQETNHPYHIGVFSDVDDKEITFYKNVTFPGGNSYYMENPQHSSMASVLFENPANQFKRKTITLDTVRRMKNLPFPDLLKIDVQGCEVDILRGATEILQNVKHLIVELQHVEYNIGAQMCDDSIPIIEAMGFELVTPKFSLSSHADADYHFKRKEI